MCQSVLLRQDTGAVFHDSKMEVWPAVKRKQNNRCQTTEEFPLFCPKAEWVGKAGIPRLGSLNVSGPQSSIQIKSKENKRRS